MQGSTHGSPQWLVAAAGNAGEVSVITVGRLVSVPHTITIDAITVAAGHT